MGFAQYIGDKPEIVLYHGTIERHVGSIARGVDVTRGSSERDFGRGVYTTLREGQAYRWARRKARAARDKPAVVRFTVRTAGLLTLAFREFDFDDPGTDYWDFVRGCRLMRVRHAHDAVYGPVALEWEFKPFVTLPDSDQMSFHSPNAVNLLRPA